MRVQLRAQQLIRRTASAIAATAVAFALLGGSALAAPPVVRDHIASAGAGAAQNVSLERSVPPHPSSRS